MITVAEQVKWWGKDDEWVKEWTRCLVAKRDLNRTTEPMRLSEGRLSESSIEYSLQPQCRNSAGILATPNGHQRWLGFG